MQIAPRKGHKFLMMMYGSLMLTLLSLALSRTRETLIEWRNGTARARELPWRVKIEAPQLRCYNREGFSGRWVAWSRRLIFFFPYPEAWLSSIASGCFPIVIELHWIFLHRFSRARGISELGIFQNFCDRAESSHFCGNSICHRNARRNSGDSPLANIPIHDIAWLIAIVVTSPKRKKEYRNSADVV